jgi:NADPH-dependent ferric siderophore reductase
MQHQIIRQRHDTRRRSLTVKAKSHITPGMIRILLEGAELHDFVSMGADDHVKLFIPGEAGEPEKRDYTPRHYDREAQTLAIDFAVHDAGPATRWAIDARPGDRLAVGGPRGSLIVSPTFDWQLLVGDETALPAIGRRVEEAPANARIISVAAVVNAGEEQSFATRARHEAIWVHRPLERADDPAPLLSAVRALKLPEGDGFIWIAAEACVARALRGYLVQERAHPPAWSRAAGYWLKGVADAHEKLEE